MLEGVAGLVLLMCLAGFVQSRRDPDKATARLALVAGALLVVGLVVFIARGDFFRPSGIDASADSGCGYERVC